MKSELVKYFTNEHYQAVEGPLKAHGCDCEKGSPQFGIVRDRIPVSGQVTGEHVQWTKIGNFPVRHSCFIKKRCNSSYHPGQASKNNARCSVRKGTAMLISYLGKFR